MIHENTHGIEYIAVDSERVYVLEGVTINMGLPNAEEVKGLNGIVGFKEEVQAPYVKFTMTVTPQTDLKKFLKKKNATVQVKWKNGKMIQISKTRYTGEGEVDPVDNKIECKYTGVDEAEEL